MGFLSFMGGLVGRGRSKAAASERIITRRLDMFGAQARRGRPQTRAERLRELGIVPAPEVKQSERERRLRELGIMEVEPEEEVRYEPEENPWIPVASSNVEAMRWVGGPFGMQCAFKNGWLYEYAVEYTTFSNILNGGSKGKAIWVLRRTGVAYRRYNPTTIPPRIIYPWGHIGGPTVTGRDTARSPRSGFDFR